MIKLTPVLSVTNILEARTQLTEILGLEVVHSNRFKLGDAEIYVFPHDAIPASMIRKPIDHMAFSQPDIFAFEKQARRRGAKLVDNYTPDGIVEIPEFWEGGMQYVFFAGPDGAPFEFCCRNNGETKRKSFEHIGVRNSDLDRAQAEYSKYSPIQVANHKLGSIDVRFFKAADQMIEAFTAEGDNGMCEGLGWVGYIEL